MHACTHTHRQRARAKHENRAKGKRERVADRQKEGVHYFYLTAGGSNNSNSGRHSRRRQTSGHAEMRRESSSCVCRTRTVTHTLPSSCRRPSASLGLWTHSGLAARPPQQPLLVSLSSARVLPATTAPTPAPPTLRCSQPLAQWRAAVQSY